MDYYVESQAPPQTINTVRIWSTCAETWKDKRVRWILFTTELSRRVVVRDLLQLLWWNPGTVEQTWRSRSVGAENPGNPPRLIPTTFTSLRRCVEFKAVPSWYNIPVIGFLLTGLVIILNLHCCRSCYASLVFCHMCCSCFNVVDSLWNV